MKIKERERSSRKPPLSKPMSPEMDRLFAVFDPHAMDYFLATGDEAFSPRLRNPNSGNVIPAEDRYVQWMPTALARFLTPRETMSLVSAIRKIERKSPKVRLNPENETDLKDLAAPQYRELLSKFARGAKTPEARIAADSIRNSSLVLRRQFEEAYYDVHSVSFGVTETHAFVFQVGRGGGMALGVPILATITADEAKKVGIYAAIFLEIILLLGRLVNVPMSSQKAADAIATALKNNRVLQAILNFINRLKADVKDIIGALYDLLVTLNELNALGPILTAAISGALGLLGILWIILQLLSFLIPGLGPAIKVAEVLAVSAALYVKVKQL